MATGSIELKSNVELHLENGATLKGSLDRRDYNDDAVFPENIWSVAEEWSGAHLVYSYQAENIAITGEGVIDGNGSAFFGECDEDSHFPWYKYGLKLHPVDRVWFRPGVMVAFFLSKNIRLDGIKLVNTPAWTCHVRCCDGFTAKGVTINADRTIANSDGFSVDCTRNVRIEKCVIKTGDDAIAIRASCKFHAVENKCENIRVRDCDVWSCCYGIRFGIGTGTVRDVEVTDSRFYESSRGVGFTPAWVAAEKNVYIEDIRIRRCFFGDTVYAAETCMPDADARLKNVLFEDCRFESMYPSLINGTPTAKAENVRFVRCKRMFIDRMKVRNNRDWVSRSINGMRQVACEMVVTNQYTANVVVVADGL